VKEQLLYAWRTNNEKNGLLLQNIGEEQLGLSLSAKGRNLGEQLAHLHNVRINWTEHVAKAIYEKSLLLSKDTTLTIPVLLTAFSSSAEKISALIHSSWEKEGKLPSFKAGLIPFISYLVSHESHHRGNILLTLKQSGYKLPDKLKWGLWEW
jgi:uncharacterized damage-inducible protein DinB